jgi:tetratricopeptide (TPR) repeat protein
MPGVDLPYLVKTAIMRRFRSNDLRLTIAAVLLLTLASLHAQEKKSATNGPQQSRAFTEALAEARRLADTDAGKAYEREFGKTAAPRMGDIVGECTKNLGPTVKLQVVFVFAADGHLEQVLGGPKDQQPAKCIGDKFRDLQLPAPPHASWPVSLSINISPDNAPRLLVEALKLMESATWEVDATISRGKKMRVHGLLAGNDFDLTLEPEDRNAVRQIAIKDQVWASFDGSKTWKPQSRSEQAPFRRVFAFVHNPLRSDAVSLALQVVKQETHDGDTWMQLRPKKSDKKKVEPQQTEYWIAMSEDPKRNGVRRYEGPVTEPGHEKEPLHCVATYQPTNDKTIQPPANAPVLPEHDSGKPGPEFAADSLKYSRDFYSKVHFVAIANLSLGSAGTSDFKYDRYPNGGPERIQCGDGEFARKTGKAWLKSSDWGETGKPVDAQTSKRLNNWVGLIQARLNGEPASNDPSEGATVMKFIGKEDQGEREEFVFEESKEKPKAKSYPHINFGRFKNAQDQQVLLSEFSGPMRLGGHEAQVKISFSHLVAVNVQETRMVWNEKEKRYVEANDNEAAESSPSQAPSTSDQNGEDLVNRGIEKAKKGDLDGAIADFDRAAKADPQNDAPYYNRAQAKWLKKDTAGAIADYTRAIDLGSTNPAAYNNRGNARVENKDREGAIADYTRAIELKPDYARAYYNRAVLKKEKGDKAGAAADFKRAQKLDPELVSEGSASDSSSDRATANGGTKGTTVSLLDGKLKLDIPSDFSRDPDDPKDPKTVAKFSGPDGAWGGVLRGTHGLTPDKLEGYLKMRVAEYSKSFKWLPKDSHLQWIKKDIITIDGRKWADWSFVPVLKGKKDYSHNPVYTRNLTTSYKGQLLEINFTSNLNSNPELKKEIDHIMNSVHLEE